MDDGNDSDINHADQFIDDKPEVHSLDQSISWPYVSWKDLPDWEEELGDLLTGILECSRIAAQGRAPATDDNNR